MSGDPKYVSSTRPINRRTAKKPRLKRATVPAGVQERIRVANAKRSLGPPLAELHRQSIAARTRQPAKPAAILSGTIATAGAVALFVGWLQMSVPLALLGIASLAFASALMFWSRRNSVAHKSRESVPFLIDPEQMQALDVVMEELAPHVSSDIVDRLKSLKHSLIHLERLATVVTVDENFTQEDRMYVVECVRRYLPDSLQSYLMVPVGQRDMALADGSQNATSLLLEQLQLLESELESRRSRLALSASEPLKRQQRFLQFKTRTR